MPSGWPQLGINILHSLHGPGFAALAVLIYCYLHSKAYSIINYFLAAAIAMAIGLLSELAQVPGSRDAQISDLFTDALGISGALGLIAAFDPRVRRLLTLPQRFALPAIASIALGIACAPTIWYSYALVRQVQSFPTLLTFESSWERAIIRRVDGEQAEIAKAPDDWVDDGKVLHGRELGRYGVFLSTHPLPDWRGYSRLVFVAAAYDQDFQLAVCIRDSRLSHDSHSSRNCHRIPVTMIRSEYTILFDDFKAATKNAHFDFSAVEAVVFSAARPGSGREVLLDNIRLEL